jgi:hypothetical protein
LDKITVFDKEGHIIGETFRRRAKQLVLKERAVWTDDNAICLLEANNTKGDNNMENQNMPFVDLREIEEAREETNTPSEDLLMYLARRNIRFRRGLIAHVIALPAVCVALAYLPGNFLWRITSWENGFYNGLLAAWGLFIFYKIILFVRQQLHSRNYLKKDPIKEEYNRLKSTSPEKISQELKQF